MWLDLRKGRGWWRATEVAGFPHVEVDTTRWSHLRPIWALDITNSNQFVGQPFWPVVWWFPAGWAFVYSHHCHLKTTWALKHVRQTLETSPRKSRSGKQWQWYTHGLLVHWCRNRVVVKSQPCHFVCESWFCHIRSHIIHEIAQKWNIDMLKCGMCKDKH